MHRRNVLYNTIYIKNIQWSRIGDDEEKIRRRILAKIRRGVKRRRPRRIYCRRLRWIHAVGRAFRCRMLIVRRLPV